MTPDTALWIGISAGLILGGAATWITIGIGMALGRHLARRSSSLHRTVDAVIDEPPTDTFDNNFRDLIRDHQKRHP